MTITALEKITIEENDLFYYEQIEKNSNPLDAFKLYSKWTNTSMDKLEGLSFKKINIDEDIFYLVEEDRNNIIAETPLYSHKITEIAHNESDLEKSLLFLKNKMPERYNLIKQFVKIIWWVSLKDEFRKEESQITSCTFPILPFSIFLSKKALYHIPPRDVSHYPSEYFLAENIFHEAVHQSINFNLLEFNILPSDYNSKEAPKVEIPWRQNQKEERNKEWEIDRLYHAAVVYKNVIGFRKEIIKYDDLDIYVKNFFENSLESALASYNHLSNSLNKHIDFFGEDGKRLFLN